MRIKNVIMAILIVVIGIVLINISRNDKVKGMQIIKGGIETAR